MLKRKWLAGPAVIMLILAVIILIVPVEVEIMALRPLTKADVLVIDPGHGGIDSGAEGSGGVGEKHINLIIGLHIKQMAETDGWKVVMTREEDKSLCNREEKQSIRSLKTADLLARKEIIKKARPLAAVSIHLNSFKQDPGVRGAQTFYPGTGDQSLQEQSRLLAECVQKNLVEGIADGTDRAALPKSDVLLFKNPVAPIIIVECGFLSNRCEEYLLTQEDYQKKIAECIYRGIMEYTGKEGRPPLKVIDNLACNE
ncbi:N-acetylmuramoyl-L-alanine amidase CwlD [Bacillota bacterium]